MKPARLTSDDVERSIRMAVAVCIEARRLVIQAEDCRTAARYQLSLSRRLLQHIRPDRAPPRSDRPV